MIQQIKGIYKKKLINDGELLLFSEQIHQDKRINGDVEKRGRRRSFGSSFRVELLVLFSSQTSIYFWTQTKQNNVCFLIK